MRPNSSCFVEIIGVIFCVNLVTPPAYAQRPKTVYQKIQQEPAFSGFRALIRSNRVVKTNLHFDNLTAFVPENTAFKNYREEFRSEIAFYHISFEIKTIEKLRTTKFLHSADSDFPPLWITKSGHDIFVNNAKILQDKTYLASLYHTDQKDVAQVLHVIDEVLDPIIPSPKFQPSAYDFLSSTDKWNLDPTKTVTSFLHKVQENNLGELYERQGGHTFFIPVDSGIDPHSFKMINRHTIYGHVIPNLVLFTKPTEKNSPYDTMANDRFIYIVVSFEEKDGKVFVRGLAGGNLGNGNGDEGEFVAEIIVPNIPVKNGVVHVVSQPLGVFNRTLKPFPYLPVLDKITNDPELDVFYRMGRETGFNDVLKKKHVKFTYFVPKDSAWIKTRKHELEPTENDLDILNRHLIISDTPYSMERLLALSRANNYTDIELKTEGGTIKFLVVKIVKDYYIKWGNRYIRVLRPDYECTNGLVHILAGPLTYFKKGEDKKGDAPGEIRMDDDNDVQSTGSAIKQYWMSFKNVWSNIF